MTSTTPARPTAGGTWRSRRLRWLWIAGIGCAVAGLAVSIYLTIEHFTSSATLACPDTTVVNCVRVTTSPQSAVAGIPLAVLGVIYFTAFAATLLPPLWYGPARWVRWSRLGLAAVGVFFVVYLLYAELFLVDAICLWCSAVHALTLALFVLTAYREAIDPV